MGENLLEMRGISKSFPGVKALDCVQITVKKGEVHALLGENGAGKSTLIKILGGIYAADSGEIAVDGKKVEMKTVDDARAAGISIVHQELCLCNNLSVARNIFLGQEVKKGVFCDDERMNREAEKLLNGLGMEIGAEEIVGDLTIAKQQMSATGSVIPLLGAGIFYYILNLLVTLGFSYAEKKLSYYR